MRTILPAKWKIIRTESNYRVINDWFNEGCGSTNYHCELKNGEIGYPNTNTGNGFSVGHHADKISIYELITFEEFERLVLNKQTNYLIYN